MDLSKHMLFQSVVALKMGIKERERRVEVFFYGLFMDVSPLAFHADAPLYISGAKTRIPAELVTCEHICDST